MSLRSFISSKLSQELILNIVNILSSVSHNVSVEDREAIAKAAVEKYLGDKTIASNNDIGMCVDALLAKVELAMTSTTTEETAYQAARSTDEFTDVIVNETAYGIASTIANNLHTLRSSVGEECESLVSAINAALPTAMQVAKPELRKFTWGSLVSPSVRMSATVIAQEKTNTFKNGAVSKHDTGIVLGKLPVEQIYAVSNDTNVAENRTAVREKLVTILKDEVTKRDANDATRINVTDEDISRYVDVLIDARKYALFIADIRILLTGESTKLGTGIVKASDMIEAMYAINNALVDIKFDPEQLQQYTVDTLLQNQAVLNRAILLMFAAMVPYKDLEFKNALIISDGVVNQDSLLSFTQQGGTEDDIVVHNRYTKEIDGLGIPSYGVSVARVIEMKDKTTKAITDYDMSRKIDAAATERAALQSAITTVLNSRHQSSDAPVGITTLTYNEMHNIALSRCLAQAGRDGISMYDVVTGYLVDMSGSAIMKNLYQKLTSALVTLVKDGITGDVAESAVNRTTCTVISDIVAEFLATKFAQ